MQTPVLFIIFNRLDTTKRVFEEIKKAVPSNLYIAADGPRTSKNGERLLCEETRKWVLDNIDWDCNVNTLFRDENFGCGKAVSQAITWFFDNVEMGIILEDDCLPNASFFNYCTKLLEKYKTDEKIMHITGFNPLYNKPASTNSYYFTKIMHCWGWASWRRAWAKYDFNITNLNEFKSSQLLDDAFIRKSTKKYWMDIFSKMENHEIDTWDYQWVYTILKNNGFCINPSKNLVSNIGFSENATHTTNINSKNSNTPSFFINTIIHPKIFSYSKLVAESIAWHSYDVKPNISHFVKSNIKRILGIKS